jgi:hypothetical protein
MIKNKKVAGYKGVRVNDINLTRSYKIRYESSSVNGTLSISFDLLSNQKLLSVRAVVFITTPVMYLSRPTKIYKYVKRDKASSIKCRSI